MGSAQEFPDFKETWVDGCGALSVLPRMWALAHHLLEGSIVTSLEEIRHAMKIVAERAHVIAEGAGACAVAAGLSGKAPGKKIVCIVSGGNIDLSRFAELTA
jgi:threonine dehydratase